MILISFQWCSWHVQVEIIDIAIILMSRINYMHKNNVAIFTIYHQY